MQPPNHQILGCCIDCLRAPPLIRTIRDPQSGAVIEALELPAGVRVSGLESDGEERFYCGGGKSGMPCARLIPLCSLFTRVISRMTDSVKP